MCVACFVSFAQKISRCSTFWLKKYPAVADILGKRELAFREYSPNENPFNYAIFLWDTKCSLFLKYVFNQGYDAGLRPMMAKLLK
jgi:hypothetical protein